MQLFNTAYEIYWNIFIQILANVTENTILEKQSGFKRGSTVDI